MKKISQGKYELFTTKADAIDKFMQLQGICREEISGEKPIDFYCTKKGKIIITNPPTKRVESHHSTNLFAEVVQQEGKTYVTYYTKFDKLNNILNLIFIVIYLLIGVLAIVFAIASKNEIYYLPILLFGVLLFGYNLLVNTKEETNSPKDSEILIKELEKRVEAVNLWDK
ncbi:MAG: hypothetical protein IKL94_01425 [Clostridia bacterium]|nr:hypothetical protein [Clostridia bacterium]